MDLYKNAAAEAIPWASLKEMANKLNQFESKLISKQSTDWIHNIKSQLLSAIDEYDSAAQSIYEMCSSTTLSIYIKLLDSSKPAILTVQKNLLTNVLDNAIEHLETTQKELGDAFSALKSVSEKFRSLLDQLKIDHDEDSDHFNDIVEKTVNQKSGFFSFFIKGKLEKEAITELKAKTKPIQIFYREASAAIRQARINLGKTTSKLVKNIETIKRRKTQVSESNAEDASKFRDDITHSAQSLIDKCQEYRQKYG